MEDLISYQSLSLNSVLYTCGLLRVNRNAKDQIPTNEQFFLDIRNYKYIAENAHAQSDKYKVIYNFVLFFVCLLLFGNTSTACKYGNKRLPLNT